MALATMMRGRLRAPDDDADGGAGGGGSGDGKFVTKDYLANVVNAAVSTHVKRVIGKAVGDAVPEIVKQVTASLKPEPGDDGGTGGGTSSDGGTGGDGGKPDPKILSLERTVAQTQKQLEEEKAARIAAETSRNQEGLRTAVLKALGENNITGERQGAAIATLYHTGRVKLAEDGAHLYVDANGDELPLGDGLKSWATSDSAKLYLPPRETKGSGDNGGGRVPEFKGQDDQLKQAYNVAIEGAAQHLLNK